MAQAVTLEIKNLDKILKLGDRFPAISRKYIDKAIVRALGEVDRETKPLTPVKTGRLRNSFIPVFRPFEGVYGTNVPYALEVHNLYEAGQRYKNPSLNKNAVAGFLVVGVRRAGAEANKAFKEALVNITKEIAK